MYLGKPHADVLMKSTQCTVCSEGGGQGCSPGPTRGNDSFEEVGFSVGIEDSANGRRHGGKALQRRCEGQRKRVHKSWLRNEEVGSVGAR